MRILMINYELPPIGGGGGKATLNIAQRLVEKGHQVRVVTARPAQLYSPLGYLLIFISFLFAVHLIYLKITEGIDITQRGFFLLCVILFIGGVQFVSMGLMWQLLIPFKGLKRTEFINGVEIHRIFSLRKKKEHCSIIEMFSFLLSGLFKTPSHVRRFKPDVIHIFFGIPCGPIGWFLKKFSKRSYIVSLRGADVPTDEIERFRKIYKYLKPFVKMIWRNASALVAVSNGLRDIALQTSGDYDIKVIPNGVDLTFFRPPSGEKDRANEQVKILHVGRLIAFKNIGTLLEAMAVVQDKTKERISLEIIGEGEKRPELESRSSELNISNIVTFSGWIEREDIVEKYQNADIFASSSIWEGMPNVVLEAMACALPIVATDVSGSRELVRDGENGYLAPPKNADALAENLLKLIENGSERKRMGRNSRRIVEEQFNWEFISDEYLKVYEETLGPRGQVFCC